MSRFRSKPIEIEAVQWFKEGDHSAVVFSRSLGGQSWASDQWVVNGHQGYSVVNPGDWIIAEPDGDGFYPCDPDTFARKYEAASMTEGHKKSSNRLATIAGSLMTIDAQQLRNRANGESTVDVLVDEIQALAASVLSQVEPMQDEGDTLDA